MFDRLQLNVADFDAADDIIEDIDDDTWVSVISLLSGDDTVYAVVKVQVWGQAGGIFGDFFGFFEHECHRKIVSRLEMEGRTCLYLSMRLSTLQPLLRTSQFL